MSVEITPEMLSLAWRTFRGDRRGQLMGPGPGFKEAIAAVAPLIEAQARAEIERLTKQAIMQRVAEQETT